MYKKYPVQIKTSSSLDSAEQAVAGLWRIDEIILNTTNIKELSEKIANVMLEELGYLKLGYEMIVLSLLDERRFLKRTSISKTLTAEKALKESPIPFEKLDFSLSEKENLATKAIVENIPYVTDDLSDMLYPKIDREIVRQVQKKLNIVCSLVFPIYSQSQPLGSIIFSLNKPESKITNFEKQILFGFTNATGIAIQHAYLFKNLHEANQKLEELDERKDEFLSVAAHELRAPMTAIKGYLSMLVEGDAGEINNETKDFLNEAIEGNERLIRLVNNMLNVSRIEEGRLVYQMGKVSLRKAVKTVFKEYVVSAREKGLEFKLEALEDIKDTVYVDQDRIHEVLANFISNAVKYTDEGSVVVRLFQLDPRKIRFEVKDSGPGMTKEELGKLFQKFYRTQSSSGKKIGTGLGLYISKLLIEKFGGVIGVESEIGKGSVFWFELPLLKQ